MQSRTTRFKFKQIAKEEAVGRLREICNAESMNVTDQALNDIVKISEGDMRKMVNTLQNIHMSLQGLPSAELPAFNIDRDYVFKLTGFPNPADIETIQKILLEAEDIKAAYDQINEIRRAKGISLSALIKDITDFLVTLQTPGNMKGNLFKRMAEIEYRLSLGCSEEKQLASMIGCFVEVRALKN